MCKTTTVGLQSLWEADSGDFRVAYVPIGLPGCGKTTFGNMLSEVTGGRTLSLGADDVRDALYPGYSAGTVPFAEMDIKHVFDVAYQWATDILRNGYDLWWDAVNTNRLHRHMVVENCREFCGRVVAIDLYVPFEEILRRNREERQGHRRPPRKTLTTMRSQRHREPVSLDEGFDEVWRFKWRGDHWRWHSTDGRVQERLPWSPIFHIPGLEF